MEREAALLFEAVSSSSFVRSSLKIPWTVQKEKYFKCVQWSCAGHSNVKL